MAPDSSVIRARLEALDDYLRQLDQLAKVDLGSFITDPRNYALAERFLHLAIECLFDIGSHCIAALALPHAESYSDILPALARAGVIQQETAAEFSSLASFRNILVHVYLAIDHELVHKFLNTRLDGFKHFAADMLAYLERSGTIK